MTYQVWIRDEAKAEAGALPGNVKQRARHAIRELGEDPRPPASREIRTGASVALEVRRLRLERWRIIYVVDEKWREVGVPAIRRRPPYAYEDLEDLLRSIAGE